VLRGGGKGVACKAGGEGEGGSPRERRGARGCKRLRMGAVLKKLNQTEKE